MPLTIQTIEELEKDFRFFVPGIFTCEYTGNSYYTIYKEVGEETFVLANGMEDYEAEALTALLNKTTDLLSAAKWALEAGYRPVSQERVSFEEVTNMEV